MRSHRRTFVLLTGISVVSLAIGFVAGNRLTSPADAAAQTAPPKASAITVPIEQRELNSSIVTRAQASDRGGRKLTVPGGGPEAVVTGLVPKVGDKVKAGEPVLEIGGRPVIALSGPLPMYRGLQPGMSGPDVEQLKRALKDLGLKPGTPADTYTAETAKAVEELYKRAGYGAPRPNAEAQQAVRSARQEVSAAEDQLADAQDQLARAGAGPSETERVQAENEVQAAERALAAARTSEDPNAIAEATGQVELAKARLADLLAAPDTSAEQKAVTTATDRLDDAKARLASAQRKAATPLPASEVAYLPKPKVQVNEVNVSLGSELNGPVMAVSGADLQLTAEVDAATRDLLTVGMDAEFEVGGSSDDKVKATIASIDAGEDGAFKVVLTPGKLTPRQFELVRGANVRVEIPLESSDGKVLAVPVAALSAGTDGSSWVEVMRGSKPERVRVEIGLTAGGFAEITGAGEGPKPKAGDQVVVGR